MRVTTAVFLTATLISTAIAAKVGAQSRPAGATPAYRVIVHPDNPVTAVDRKFLADAFLKKVTFWGTGEVIRPADLDAENAARRRFSDEVLRRSVAAVKSYWQQMVFSGRDVPPPELDSDEDVIRYVLKQRGGVGYISGTASAERVKFVTVK